MPVTIEVPVALSRARFHGKCTLGAFSYFNGKAEVFHTQIGRYCSIAQDVIIGPGEHPTPSLSTHPFTFRGARNRFKKSKEYRKLLQVAKSTLSHCTTKIGSDVWIGAKCFVSQGVTIHNGSIIGAGAVVTRDIPPYSIAAGTPARVIRTRFDEELVERLEQLQWWNYSMDRELIGELDYTNVEKCISTMETLISGEQLKPIRFKKKTLPSSRYQRIFSF